jgi:hypothetical protein
MPRKIETFRHLPPDVPVPRKVIYLDGRTPSTPASYEPILQEIARDRGENMRQTKTLRAEYRHPLWATILLISAFLVPFWYGVYRIVKGLWFN